MNSAVMFAGLFLACFSPFLAVVDAATGRSTQKTITLRMGLSGQAAQDVDALVSAGHWTRPEQPGRHRWRQPVHLLGCRQQHHRSDLGVVTGG
jgi:hypothetical protein